MKKNFKLPVVVAVATALTMPVMAQTKFPDVVDGAWYTSAIESAVENGLFNGYNDGTLKPENTIKRAEIAAVLTKAFGATEHSSLDRFVDTKYDAWYYNYMSKAVNMKIFAGDNTNRLNPEKPITREEAAIVISRAFELTSSGKDVLAKFSDKNEVSTWAVPFVSALVENGYMVGNNKGQLNPKGSITRAEFAQIMYNITKDYIVEAGTVTNSFDGNVLVRVAGVTLKDATVGGDVIVADGVGTGEFTLDNVIVNGDLVIRGGGINSIKLVNNAGVLGKIILRNPNGKTRIYSDSKIETIIEANSSVIIDAEVDEVIVNASAKVEVTGNVGTIVVNAENVSIYGNGKLEKVSANANNVDVTVRKALVTAAEGVTGVMAGDKKVAAGTTEVVKLSSGGGASGGKQDKDDATENLTVKISKNSVSGYYEIDWTDGEFSGLDGTAYNVTIEGVVDITRTVETGIEALALAKDILTSEAIANDYRGFMASIDNRKAKDDFDSDVYNNLKTIMISVADIIMPDDANYKKLVETEKELIAKYGSIENVSFEDYYVDFEGKNGDLKQFITELHDVAVEGENADIVEAIMQVYADKFVEKIL